METKAVKSRAMRGFRTFCAAVVALGCCAAAAAHEIAPSYLSVVTRSDSESGLRLRWELPLAELRWTVDLDADGDGTIAWEEVEARRTSVAALALESLEVARGPAACTLTPSGFAASRHAEADYAAVELDAACPEEGALRIDNRMFFGDHPTHQLLLDVSTGGGRFTSALSPLAMSWSEPRSASWLGTLAEFLRHGIWHIWIGYDHIAFLTLLLLPSVLRNDSGRWQVAGNPRAVIRDLVLIVTAFTLAHSVTLGLAATGMVSLPTRPIEIAIALSIVIAGLLNLDPRIARLRLPLAFAFGLVHGFGFANALAELGAGGVPVVPMLAGFNLGVEVGQLAIVAVVLPLLLWLRRLPLYPRRLMPAASLATAIAGAIWVMERW
jgi:hypothetical protein